MSEGCGLIQDAALFQLRASSSSSSSPHPPSDARYVTTRFTVRRVTEGTAAAEAAHSSPDPPYYIM